MRRVAIVLLCLCSSLACSDPASESRLIPPGDTDHAALETPENAGECAEDLDCEISCVHACAPVPTGPVTCPLNPPPPPARVEGAVCLCDQGVCAYF